MPARFPVAVLRLTAAAFVVCLSSCSPAPAAQPNAASTYDPFLHLSGTPMRDQGAGNAPFGEARSSGPAPTRAPLTVNVPTRAAGAPLVTPTPNPPRSLPTLRAQPDVYIVQPGDTLASVAEAFGISIEALRAENGIADANLLAVGTSLKVPAPAAATPGPSFKIIPDSELAYGPASAEFAVEAFISNEGGYLASYTEDVGTQTLTGTEIVERVAQDYSINPRLLLALIEHRSHWITTAQPVSATLDYPLGLALPGREGLYHQLAWAATELNRGYYLWRAGAIGTWVLNDGSIVPIDPTINAGTAGVESLFSVLDDRAAWEDDVTVFGIFQTYFFLFGDPFDMAIEPLVPLGLTQPHMELPIEHGSTWAFTGGPHAAWDAGSAWAALDFAPPDIMGCAVSQQWVTAVADGFIVRAADGQVIQDLDGDGYEQTGWDMLYMHVFSQDRVQAGSYVYAGDRIGHPSCEGGIANATHLHIARKFNGEWIPADGSLPFVLGGWTSSGTGVEYDGHLSRGSTTLEAAEGSTALNQISR